jgi:hypothetical protein
MEGLKVHLASVSSSPLRVRAALRSILSRVELYNLVGVSERGFAPLFGAAHAWEMLMLGSKEHSGGIDELLSITFAFRKDASWYSRLGK